MRHLTLLVLFAVAVSSCTTVGVSVSEDGTADGLGLSGDVGTAFNDVASFMEGWSAYSSRLFDMDSGLSEVSLDIGERGLVHQFSSEDTSVLFALESIESEAGVSILVRDASLEMNWLPLNSAMFRSNGTALEWSAVLPALDLRFACLFEDLTVSDLVIEIADIGGFDVEEGEHEGQPAYYLSLRN